MFNYFFEIITYFETYQETVASAITPPVVPTPPVAAKPIKILLLPRYSNNLKIELYPLSSAHY